MANGKTEIMTSAAGGFGNLPLLRQLGVLIAFAASIALGVGIVLWSMEPNYRPLVTQTDEKNTAAILDVLQRAAIKYKIDNRGQILVDDKDVYQARLKLASEGISNNSGISSELFGKQNGLGTSQFMESLRYLNALENELSKTISQMQNIKSARVHLAVPRQSALLQDQKKPSASVFVDVYAGNILSPSQIAAIVNLVGSSVPNLQADQVTLVDGQGNLLTQGGQASDMMAADKRFNYQKSVEAAYTKQIVELLTPVLGPGKIRAQVSMDLDFTRLEQTQEIFNPDNQAVRSEQSSEEKRLSKSAQPEGVPGTLSNQPPVQTTTTGTPPAGAAGGTPAASAAESAKVAMESSPSDLRKQVTKNYEVDKTTSYITKQPGEIQRLSVAVVVDDHTKINQAGKTERTALTAEEIDQLTKLVKDAIGFDEKRGDRVTVINRSFAEPPPAEAVPEEKIWEKPWVIPLIKQIFGGIFVILILFGVLRPFLTTLASRQSGARNLLASGGVNPANMPMPMQGEYPPGTDMMQNELGDLRIPGPQQSYEEQMQAVKKMASQDPKRVAHIVKKWVDEGS